jgi:hypothetical protein
MPGKFRGYTSEELSAMTKSRFIAVGKEQKIYGLPRREAHAKWRIYFNIATERGYAGEIFTRQIREARDWQSMSRQDVIEFGRSRWKNSTKAQREDPGYIWALRQREISAREVWGERPASVKIPAPSPKRGRSAVAMAAKRKENEDSKRISKTSDARKAYPKAEEKKVRAPESGPHSGYRCTTVKDLEHGMSGYVDVYLGKKERYTLLEHQFLRIPERREAVQVKLKDDNLLSMLDSEGRLLYPRSKSPK